MNNKTMDFINLLKNARLENDKEAIYKIENNYENKMLLEYILENTNLLNIEFGIENKNNFLLFKINKNSFFRELNCHYFSNKNDFINFFKLKKLNFSEDNDNFYIEELKICSKTDKEKLSKEKFFKAYFALSKIIFLFENIKDDFNSTEESYILHFQNSFRVKNNIDLQTIKEFEDERKRNNFEKILNKLISDTTNDKNQNLGDAAINQSFLKKAIRDNIKPYLMNNNKISFTEIVKNIEAIFDDYELIKKAYIDSLNPDIIKEKFLSKYTDTLNALNSILSDLYTKSLFVPITAIFALFTRVYKNENKPISNYIEIWLGIILIGFLGVLAFFIKGYSPLLKNIKLQIDSLEQEVEKSKSNSTFWIELDQKMDSLKKTYNSVRNRVWFIYGIIIVSTLFIAYILFC